MRAWLSVSVCRREVVAQCLTVSVSRHEVDVPCLTVSVCRHAVMAHCLSVSVSHSCPVSVRPCHVTCFQLK